MLALMLAAGTADAVAKKNTIVKPTKQTVRVQKRKQPEKKVSPGRKADPWAKKGYMKVNSIDFENVNHNEEVLTGKYDVIYDDELRYLRPVLNVTPHTDVERDIDFLVKIYDPDGDMMTGSGSPSGYTYADNRYLYPYSSTVEMGGWGNADGGTYDPGTYRFEIYTDAGVRIATSNVTIYKGNGNNNYYNANSYTASGLKFENCDYDNNVLTSSGNILYSEDMRYLRPTLVISNASRKCDAKLKVKIYSPDGSLRKPDGSDDCTYTCDRTIYSTTTEIPLIGWGNNTVSTYDPGVYRVEVWDGDTEVAYSNVSIFSKNTPYLVTDLYFENVDEKNNVLNSRYEDLTESSLRYLRPVVKIEPGISYGSKTSTFYIKIFNKDGTLKTGTGSPSGYTCKVDRTIYPSTEELALIGWGSSKGGVYSKGDYKVEIWSESHELMYTGYAHINGSGQRDVDRVAEIEKMWTEHNVTNTGSAEGIKVHTKLRAKGYKGEKLKLTLHFYRGSLEYEYTSDLNADYEDTIWNDQWIWVPNAKLAETFGSTSGTSISYEMIFKDKYGNVLDRETDSMVWN